MTKNQKLWTTIAVVMIGIIALLFFIRKPKTIIAPASNGEANPSPYYLTYNIPPPGSTNIGAPYYGDVTFNRGCGCDGGNNVTPNNVAENTGNNNQLTSAVSDPSYSYITSIIRAE